MNVLITGASRGVGRAIALTLADDHDVAVNYRTSADAAADVVEAAERNGSTAVAVEADVRDPRPSGGGRLSRTPERRYASARVRLSTRSRRSHRRVPAGKRVRPGEIVNVNGGMQFR
ncbi:hypothetical protein JCM18237_00140 [Halorubrum luteum]